ncbi:hypothetical protein K3495_g5296 [Podosphaera aphanis]|nr:hypothetical protein K3495_g5296 [Podosphaera aphanis]
MISYAAVHDLELDHLDVNTAFLNPKLKQPNYMEILPYFHLPHLWIRDIEKNFYLILKKALYGLKQLPREWFLEIKQCFHEMGLKQCDADPNLFISSPKMEKKQRVYILFVDYMLISEPNPLVNQTKTRIMNKWKCKDLGPVKTFESYVRKLLGRTGVKNCNGVPNPLDCGTVLRERADDKLLDAENSALYQQIVGLIIYLSNNTRPDISYAVGQLVQFMSKPRLSFPNHSKTLPAIPSAKDEFRYHIFPTKRRPKDKV